MEQEVSARQPMYVVFAASELEKKDFLESGLCIVIDWSKGVFVVPLNMRAEFYRNFQRWGTEYTDCCQYDITSQDIQKINTRKLR